MAVVNPTLISPIVYPAAANVKDSRWLTLDVCREYTRNKCSRSDDECRFAHPPPNVEVQNGRVMCCFDSIKGKCQRRDPPCKYLHPPQHLKEQLLQNGRNNLILKHLQMQMIAHSIPGVYPIMYDMNTGKSFSTGYIPIQGQEPYLVPRYIVPNGTAYGSYYTTTANGQYASPAVAGTYTTAVGPNGPASIPPYTTVDNGCVQPLLLVGSPASTGQPNGLQVDNRPENCNVTCQQNGNVNVGQPQSPVWQSNGAPPSPSMLPIDTSVSGATYSPPIYFQTTNGIVPYMKPGSATGDAKCATVPYYQPAAFAYQQMALAAMQLQQPTATYAVPITIAGHAPVEPRY